MVFITFVFATAAAAITLLFNSADFTNSRPLLLITCRLHHRHHHHHHQWSTPPAHHSLVIRVSSAPLILNQKSNLFQNESVSNIFVVSFHPPNRRLGPVLSSRPGAHQWLVRGSNRFLLLGYPLSLSNPSLTPLAYPFLTVINSLLTPISHFARSECTAAVDNRVGLCMPKSACLSSGGYVAGSCGFVLSCCVCKLPKIFL